MTIHATPASDRLDKELTRLVAPPVLGAALLGLDDLGVPRGGAAERRLRSEFRAAV